MAEFESRKQVEESVAVSLAALGERLYWTNRRKLAAQLPDELKVFLEREVEAEAVRQDVPRYSLEEYYQRVAAREIDREIKKLLDQAYGRARDNLEEHRDSLEHLVQRLLEEEEIPGEEVNSLVGGKKKNTNESGSWMGS